MPTVQPGVTMTVPWQAARGLRAVSRRTDHVRAIVDACASAYHPSAGRQADALATRTSLDIQTFTAGVLGLLVATVVLFGVELTRVFVADLVFVVDQSRRTALALATFGTFASPVLVPLLARILGWRRLHGIALIGLWVTRLLVQGIADPLPRVVLAGIGLVCWGWVLIWLLRMPNQPIAWGILAGLVVDIGLRVLWQTIDLPWLQAPAPLALTTALVLSSAAFAVWEEVLFPLTAEPQGRQLSRLAVIGPALAIFQIIAGNPGFVLVHGGRTLPLSVAVLGSAIALGWCLTLWLGRHWLGWAALVLVGSLGLWLAWRNTQGAFLGIVLAVLAWSALLSIAVRGSDESASTSLWPAALWIAVGLLIHVAGLFWYYTGTGDGRALAFIWGMLSLIAAVCWPHAPVRRNQLATLGSAVVLLLAIGVATLMTMRQGPEAAVQTPLPSTFSVMTYNIQSGFARDHRWNLEETARTIAAVHPDVVVLQEVSRGWLVTTGVDDLLWLSRRLGMQAVWGPTSSDGLWGNAILTTAPIVQVERLRYPQTQNLRRGAVAVSVQAQHGTIWVVGTHLDDPRNADAVRLAQTANLLSFVADRRPLVLAGDFNADPGTPVVTHVLAVGLVDTGASFDPDFTTSSDRRRIDYIFVSPPLQVEQAGIVDRWSSDHRPVVAWLRLPSAS